jgi:hypothetical protein
LCTEPAFSGYVISKLSQSSTSSLIADNHTYKRTYVPPYIHTYTHIHTNIHAYVHSTHTQIYSYMRTYIYLYTYVYTTHINTYVVPAQTHKHITFYSTRCESMCTCYQPMRRGRLTVNAICVLFKVRARTHT